MNKREAERQIDALVERHFDFLERLARIPCPTCRVTRALVIYAEGQHIRVRCEAPIPRAAEDDQAYCYMEWVYNRYATGVHDLPEPKFTPIEPRIRNPHLLPKRPKPRTTA